MDQKWDIHIGKTLKFYTDSQTAIKAMSSHPIVKLSQQNNDSYLGSDHLVILGNDKPTGGIALSFGISYTSMKTLIIQKALLIRQNKLGPTDPK